MCLRLYVCVRVCILCVQSVCSLLRSIDRGGGTISLGLDPSVGWLSVYRFAFASEERLWRAGVAARSFVCLPPVFARVFFRLVVIVDT